MPKNIISNRVCSIADCNQPYYGKGYCKKHYGRVLRHGSPELPTKKICSIAECGQRALAKGLCNKHYLRLRNHGSTTPTFRSNLPGTLLEFIEEAVRSQTEECIIWPFYKCNSGYGMMNYQGRKTVAHRVALIMSTGQDPKGMEAMHGPCHNRLCVNPRHLSWGTRSRNQLDKVRDGTDSRGEKSWTAKLTEQDVSVIRSRLANGEYATRIAKDYNITSTTIYSIKHGKAWNTGQL